jgi:hypothetical protein
MKVLTLLAVSTVTALALNGVAATISETFNTGLDGWAPDAVWSSTSPGFGWSNTSHAGGTAGEIGGELDMNGTTLNSFGTSLGGTYNLNSPFSASGNFAITGESPVGVLNYYVGIGFYNSAYPVNSSSNNVPQLGFQLAEYGNSTALRAKLNLGLANGTDVNPNPAFFLPTNFTGFYTFNVNYDPTIGNGRLTVQIFQNGTSAVSGTGTYNLSATDRNSGTTFDSFGLMSGGNGDAGFEDVWMDNFSAVAVVPEPSCAALLILGAGTLLGIRRQRRV